MVTKKEGYLKIGFASISFAFLAKIPYSRQKRKRAYVIKQYAS